MRYTLMVGALLVGAVGGCGAAGSDPAAASAPSSTGTATATEDTVPAGAHASVAAALGSARVAAYKCDCGDERVVWPVPEGQPVVCQCGEDCECDHGPIQRYTAAFSSPSEPAAGPEPITFELTLRDAAGTQVEANPGQMFLYRAAATPEDREVVELVDLQVCAGCGALRADVVAATAGTYEVEMSFTLPGLLDESTLTFPIAIK